MSTNHTNWNGRTQGELARRPLFLTACVAGLAAAVAGCTTSSTGAKSSAARGPMYSNQLADRSGVTIDPNATVGLYDAAWYATQAGQASLPPLWLGEAVQATSDVQTTRASAIASRVSQRAGENAAIAGAEAELRGAMSDEQIALATAGGAGDALNAKIAELSTKVTSQQSAYESKARLDTALVNAMVQDRQAEFEKMRSQAVSEFNQAQAEHQRMVSRRQAVEQNGLAEIAKMVKISDMTESRAASKVTALRTEADSISRQTDAQVLDLNQQIQSTTEQIAAESSKLRQQAASLEEEGKATSSELMARADALDQRDVEQQFQLQTKTADLNYGQAKASFDESMQQADAMVAETEAAVVRMRADSERFRLVSEADFQQQVAATERFKEHNLADVFVKRAQADRLERDSRSEFVKAQAEALAQAAREEAAHLNELAEKQYEEIKAQAEADAARIRTEMIALLAQQMQAKSTELPGKVDGGVQPAGKGKNAMAPIDAAPVTADAATPAQPDVPAKPAVIVPEHVARFKSALAETTKLRAQADAAERAVMATFTERTRKLSAWWEQQQAKHQQMLAEAGAFTQQAMAKTESIRNQADRSLRLAKADHERAVAEAEAFRKDTFAQIMNLRAQAAKVAQQSSAEATRLLAQAEAEDNGGAAELRAMEAQRDAVRRRGDAKVQQFLAEADSVQSSQRALVAQMRQEIASSNQILAAELTRLDQSAESYMQIADATYQEAVTIADTFAEKTRIASNAMTIDSEVDRKIAQANVDHLRNVVNAQELSGRAGVERMIAQANANREMAESNDIATRASVFAETEIAESFIRAKLAAADATDAKVRAVFESRIASVQADRDRAFAQRYLSETEQQNRLAKAQAAADAYRDLSTAAVAMLNEKTAAFQNAAKVNWDARLAMPSGSVELDWPTLDPTYTLPGDGQLVTPRAFSDVNERFDN